MRRSAISLVLTALCVATGCAGLRPLNQKSIDEAIKKLENSPQSGTQRPPQGEANKPKFLTAEKPPALKPTEKEASLASSVPIKIPRAMPTQSDLQAVSAPASPDPSATPIPIEPPRADEPAQLERPGKISLEADDQDLYVLKKPIRPSAPATDPEQPEVPVDDSPRARNETSRTSRPTLKAVEESTALLKPPGSLPLPPTPTLSSKESAEEPPVETPAEPPNAIVPAPSVVTTPPPTPPTTLAKRDEKEVVVGEEPAEEPATDNPEEESPPPPVFAESRRPAPPRLAEPVREFSPVTRPISSQPAVAKHGDEPALRLDRMHFCTEIMGFGQTSPVEANEFRPDQRLMLYVEVQNFASRAEDRLYETYLTSQVIVTNKEGQLVFTHQFDRIVDRCHERRHEFFCHYVFDLPASLPAGDYKVTLLIYDEQSHQTAAQSVDLVVNPSNLREKEGFRP